MSYLISQEQVEILAQTNNVSFDAMVDELAKQNTFIAKRFSPYTDMEKIIERINRRLNGEFVTPAWVEALRKK